MVWVDREHEFRVFSGWWVSGRRGTRGGGARGTERGRARVAGLGWRATSRARPALTAGRSTRTSAPDLGELDRSEDRLRITHLSEDLRGESRLALGGDRLFEERHVLEELRRSAGARGRVSEGTSASSGRVSGEGSVRSREARSGSPEPVVHAPDIRGLARHAPHPARLAGRRASPPSPASSHPCPPRLSSPRPRPCGRRTSVSRCDVAATENLRHLVQTRRSAHIVTVISSEECARSECVLLLSARRSRHFSRRLTPWAMATPRRPAHLRASTPRRRPTPFSPRRLPPPVCTKRAARRPRFACTTGIAPGATASATARSCW